MTPRSVVHAAVLLAAVALTACSAAPGPSLTPNANAAFIDGLIAEAQAAGADAGQIEVLEAAAARGEMTYDDAAAQLEPYFGCLEDAGLEPTRWPDREDPPGYRVPAYTVGLGGDEDGLDAAVALLEACYTLHYEFVDTARQVQPSAVEAQDADLEAHRTEIEACLAAHGEPVDPGATIDELASAAIDLGLRTDEWCYEFG